MLTPLPAEVIARHERAHTIGVVFPPFDEPYYAFDASKGKSAEFLADLGDAARQIRRWNVTFQVPAEKLVEMLSETTVRVPEITIGHVLKGPQIATVLDSEIGKQLEGLHLYHSKLSAPQLKSLAARFAKLSMLVLDADADRGTKFDSKHAAALADASFPKIRGLGLSGWDIGTRGADIVAACPELRAIDGSGQLHTSSNLQALLRVPSLTLGSRMLSDLVRVLVAAIGQPRRLSLIDAHLSSVHLRPILAAPIAAKLEELSLRGNRGAGGVFDALPETLRVLEATNIDASASDARALAVNKRLERLDVRDNPALRGAIAPMLSGGGLPALRTLILDATHVDDALVAVLAARTGIEMVVVPNGAVKLSAAIGARCFPYRVMEWLGY
jgi:hypothetical protein